MNLDEIGQVLAKLAAFDQRTVGEADLLAWYEVVGHFELPDCLAAVTEHYRETGQRAMPADIRRLAIRIRDERHSREENERRRLALESGAVRDRSDEVKALVRSVAQALPKPDVHVLAKERAQRERGRPEPAPKVKRATRPAKDNPAPLTDDIASLATRYLLDGHEPAAVAERFGVSRRWCEQTLRRLRPDAGRTDPAA